MMSRATVDAVNVLPEQNRVLRLVVPALGFPSVTYGYRREHRAAGRSKYPFAKMLRLSVDGLTGFSIAPLRLATAFGLIGGLTATVLLLFALVSFATGHTAPGWTSTFVAVSAVGAVQLLCLGLLGEYVGTHVHDAARAAVVLHRLRLSRAGPWTTAPQPGHGRRHGRRALTSSDTPGRRRTGRYRSAVTTAVRPAFTTAGSSLRSLPVDARRRS
jgi:dolichol-phosphate mannosyltransferase